MQQKKYKFPYIQVTKVKSNYEGAAGLALKSILRGELLMRDDDQRSYKSYLDQLDPEKLQLTREALITALAACPPELVLEMHITSVPNLVYRAQSHIYITLFIRARGQSEERVKERIAAYYLSLTPLLQAYLPEAEFIPLCNKKDLAEKSSPFEPGFCLSVTREKEVVELTAPMKKASIGFNTPIALNGAEQYVAKHIFPWRPSLDDWSKLLISMTGQLDPIQIIIRLQATEPAQKTTDRLRETMKNCELFLAGASESELSLRQQASAIRDISLRQIAGLQKAAFKLGVYIVSPCSLDKSMGNILGSSFTGILPKEEANEIFYRGFTVKKIPVVQAAQIHSFSETEPVTAKEAACCFRLPSPPISLLPGLPVKNHRTNLAILPDKDAMDTKQRAELFINVHQGLEQPVHIGLEDRFRHSFLLGQTGVGKSTFMERLLLQDIRSGRGLALIDPHGELVDSLLGKIPPERAEDVIIFDILDSERPLGFNLLEWRTLEERDLIIDELYLTIDRTYDLHTTGGPIFEANFRGMLGLLMGDDHRGNFIPTLLDFVPCYQNKEFRKWLKKSITDPQILDFVKELEDTSGEAALKNLSPYITSKFSRFTNDRTLKRIIGQSKTNFNFEEIMDKQKIFLVKLGKGRFGSVVSALIANQLVSRFKMAAMKRGELPEENRKPFFLYVDEAHNLPGENFTELLAEARKYKMGLVLATQYAAQLKDTAHPKKDLLSGIIGNVGTILTFRLGYQDAEDMAPAFYPHFKKHDIIGLPNWQGYARMQLNNEATQPFSFITRKDEAVYNQQLAEKIKKLSRLKYGTDEFLVDNEILERREAMRTLVDS